MTPSGEARHAAAVTLSKGKMYEFGVPDELHIKIPDGLDLKLQFPLAVGTICEFANELLDKALSRRTRTTAVPDVLFSAQVLVATVDSKVALGIDGEIRLIAASAFFLANSPGRAAAHVKLIERASLSRDNPLGRALLTALTQPWAARIRIPADLPEPAVEVLRTLKAHYSGDAEKADVLGFAERLRLWAHDSGDSQELLFGYLLAAVAAQRATNSAWTRLPEYTGVAAENWRHYLLRPEAIKDMWPSQQMLGSGKVYAGASAIVQMPTSAGKTRATELILRSSFQSKRTQLAIIVAPFRALCYEIAQDLRSKFYGEALQINQLSDALQQDYKLDLRDFLKFGVATAPHVVILTPEKLMFVMRQEPDFVSNVGLVIYDEGHQFDDSGRGVAYELLITSIKRALPADAQTVLISAVISNARDLAAWLLADEEKVISDSSAQTSRHVAFATMERGANGSLKFDPIIQGEQGFYVPRLISYHTLTGKTKPIEFPTTDSGSIALYLGLKLIENGGVAIFVGKPESATKIVREAVNSIFPRSIDIDFPSAHANEKELKALSRLYSGHFGDDAIHTKGAGYGIYSHTGDTPQGIRLAVEHAMRESLVSLVICTSTLAQGVNLPIRYLLVTSPYNSGKLLKTRDFQNLAGRAGRAGMYGDGTVLFTDSRLFDDRKKNVKKWRDINALLKPEESAPTSSALLRLVKPIHNSFNTSQLPIDASEVITALIDGDESIYEKVSTMVGKIPPSQQFSEKDSLAQLTEKNRTISSVQTFLMSHRAILTEGNEAEGVRNLLLGTYAYHLANEGEQEILEWAFLSIWSAIAEKALAPETQIRYGRSLLGLNLSLTVDGWVRENLFELEICSSPSDVLDVVWSFIDSSPLTEKLQKLVPSPARRTMVQKWIDGEAFRGIREAVLASGGTIRYGTKTLRVSDDTIVGFCQNELAFQGCLLLNAVSAAYAAINNSDEEDDVISHFDVLGKMMKYGLPTEQAVAVYEVGFADRVLSQALANRLPPDVQVQATVKAQFRRDAAAFSAYLEDFPDYYKEVLNSAIR